MRPDAAALRGPALALALFVLPVLLLLYEGPGLPVRSASAAPAGQAAESDLDRAARDIARVLKCPVCQNASVADSPSDLAQQMRDLIRRKLEAGESREQIIAFFVERYGSDALLDPPRAGVFGVLWWGTAAIVAGGVLVLGVTLRGWRRAARAARAGRPIAAPAPAVQATMRGGHG